MKKISCITFLLTCILAKDGMAQDVYLKAGIGYMFPMPGQKIDEYGNALNGTVSTGTSVTGYDLKNASFSAGLPLMIGGGVMLSKNIGVELNGTINLVPKKYTEKLTGEANSQGQAYDYIATRQAKNTILLMPSLLLQTANDGCNLYMRMGVALPVNTGIKQHETVVYQQSGNVYDYDWKIQNYLSLGFTGAAGVKFKISDHTTFWAEASMLYLNLSRKEKELTTAEVNGSNIAPSQLTGVTKYHYSKNGIADANGNENSFSQPFSSMGVSVGVSFGFGKSGAGKKKK